MFPINIGIDFGTSFSKICVRGPGPTGAAVCSFGKNLPSDALVPSIVYIENDGRVRLPHPGDQDTSGGEIRFLKMALADLTTIKTIGLSPDLLSLVRENVEPLATLFLSHLIGLAKDWVADHWEKHVGHQEVFWSANVGVPVAYYDSAIKEKFSRVMAVAWSWHEQRILPKSIEEARRFFDEDLVRICTEDSRCQPVPEIGAAVLSFASSRAARPGVYIYFDVGGGTLDGVAFKLDRDDGTPKVDFYSGDVEPLGVMAVAESLERKYVKTKTFRGDEMNIQSVVDRIMSEAASDLPEAFEERQLIMKLVGKVIVWANRVDGRNWRLDLIQHSNLPKPYWVRANEEDIRPLTIFMGGGGWVSGFYCNSIGDTYEEFGHRSAGIPPYGLTKVPNPEDLDLGRLSEGDFLRFIIAYGLSVPLGEGPDIKLPSQFELAPPAPVRDKGPGYEYGDTKDIFD
jgi:hypothetical protein